MKILWIGPFIPSQYASEWPASSPAASKWQLCLLQGLFSKNINIEFFYYRPDSYWPKGRLLPFREKLFLTSSFKIKQIKYLNIPGFRNLTKKFFLKRILKKTKSDSINTYSPIIITYNTPKWIKKVFLDNKICKDFIKLSLCADDKIQNIADGYIFLSYYQFKKCKYKNKIHYDGALYHQDKSLNLKKTSINKKKIIFLYTGSFTKYGGIKILLDAIKLIKSNNFELWISGYGDDNIIKTAEKNDSRIKYFGLLLPKKLNSIYQKADIFLNPRPINEDSNFNFPSKLYEYLVWKKPIISTFTKGLSPDYKNVLYISKDNAQAFASAMILHMEKKIKFKINKNFFINKSLDNQLKKLIFFLNKLQKKRKNSIG
jgi:glycosyltransferase involved in cell wall biosynthesis